MKDLYSDFRKFATEKKINGRYLSGTVLDDYKKTIKTPNILLPQNYQSVGVVDESQNHMIVVDVYTKMIQNNIIFVNDIDDESADVICAQLLYLTNTDDSKDIHMYLNSGGGSIYSGNEILSLMHYIPNTINTICLGLCASYGAVILANGDFGHRYALPNSTIMIHQPLMSGGLGGPAADLEISVNEINRLKDELFQNLSDRTGIKKDELIQLANRDFWMDANKALELHIVDSILKPSEPKISTYNEWLETKD